ncbi:hypothetical protein AAV94_12780 [Lampropedia cohaerens]|uniref:Phosphodiesterase n=1 Tax=Lampropedia cohaerens TaxID=1610491 RepID=A0A0U1PWM4_9BURK|nr:hypothetical protein [Lampropedia cohaerens]KKW66943.1 hypothetical protein AAV94_12780 [Lampropedia cohaerens]
MTNAPPPGTPGLLSKDDYIMLVRQWSQAEQALHRLLRTPHTVADFPHTIDAFRTNLERVVSHDSDTALFMMFQLAATSTVGYSGSHALVCGVLCLIASANLPLSLAARKTLTHAALTMNIAMTELQDTLALQTERPSASQDEQIRTHAARGATLLAELGVNDALWLDVVRNHHTPPPDEEALAALPLSGQLTRVLASIDRYAAMISPRKSRPGRTVADSLRAIMGQRFDPQDEIGKVLASTVGLYPPGTLVKLETQEVALVLRRTADINHPLVAAVLDADGKPYPIPVLHLTSRGKLRILGSLPWSTLPGEISEQARTSLGLFTARQGLRGA